MARCNSCGADIEWATTASGKSIPLDIEPAANGNLAFVNGRTHAYTAEDARLGRERRITHFVTCPQRDEWRRSNG